MKGLTNTMKNNRIFYQIFIPILALATISIIIISTFVTFNSTNRMQQILNLSIKDNLQQMIFHVENDLTLLESTLTAFSTSSSYNEIVSDKLLPTNVTDYRSIVDQIHYLEALNGANNVSYSITSIDGKWSIINGSLRQLTTSQLASIENDLTTINGLPQQIVWSNENGKITFTAYLPYFSTKKSSIAQGNIDEQTLLRSINSATIDNLLIFNRSGNILLEYGTNSHDLNSIIEPIKNSNTKEGIIEINQSNYYYSTNSSGNRYYVIQFDNLLSQIRREHNPYWIFLISGLAILIISSVSFYVARKIATPISKIQKSMANLSNKNIANSPHSKDELSQLASSIEALINDTQTFTQFYEADQLILKNQFIINLLNNQLSKHRLESRLTIFDYKIENNVDYYVLISKIDYLKNNDNQSIDLWYFGINKIIEETIDHELIFDSTLMNSETQVTILKIDRNKYSNTQTHALALSESILQNVSDILKLQISIGLSSNHHDLSMLHLAFKEAQQAIQQKRNFSNSSVTTFSDIAQKGNDLLISFYPDDIEDRIKQEILVGNKEAALTLLEAFFNRLQEYATSSVSIEIAAVRLINSLLMLNQQLGLHRIKEIQAQQPISIYQRVTEFHNLTYIKQMISNELILPMLAENEENTDTIFKSLSNEIKNIIKQNYDLDITLESIADDLHYNPNYLSNVFKKEVGISFTDYLNNYRLKMSKKLLIETDMPIKDIAEKLRYTNSQNFIRFFKKNEGMTPGAYRQENSKN